MCKKLIDKEKVVLEIEKLKKFFKIMRRKKTNNYNWKNIDLVELIKGEYKYLNEIFVLITEEIPDNKS